MKTILLGFITSILIIGCNNNNDIEQSYKKSTEFNIDVSKRYINLATKIYVNNPEKHKHYFNKANRIHNTANRFINTLNQISKDSLISVASSKLIIQKYKSTLDSLGNYKTTNCRSNFIINNEISNYDANPYLYNLIMQNNIAIYESELLRFILQNIDGQTSNFYKINIETESNRSEDKYDYSFNLNSFDLQTIPNKTIIVDTISKNKKLTNIKPVINQIPIFASINIDSLSNGSYNVKGRVKVINYYGGSTDFPFQHSFTINKAPKL